MIREYGTVTVDHSVSGIQKPWKIFAGPISVEGKFNVLPEDLTEYTRYVSNTRQASLVTFTQAAGASIVLQMSKSVWTDVNPDRGSDQMKYPVTFKAFGNTTDVGASGGFSPIKATVVQNLRSMTTWVPSNLVSTSTTTTTAGSTKPTPG